MDSEVKWAVTCVLALVAIFIIAGLVALAIEQSQEKPLPYEVEVEKDL